MKKRINIMFFGICFLAALLGEAYCIEILKGDLFSTIGIGIVALITGYLFMDSIISTIKQNMEEIKFYTDRTIREEDEKWNERFTEIINFQKATYTATKKNAVMLTQQIKEVMSLLEDMEGNNIKELHRVTELQKISMEGQKNALKMEVQYNKENTKKLLGALKEYDNKSELENQLSKIIDLLEKNNELMKTRITSIGGSSADTGNIDQAEDNAWVSGEAGEEIYNLGAVDTLYEEQEPGAVDILNEEPELKAAEIIKEEPVFEATEIINEQPELEETEAPNKESKLKAAEILNEEAEPIATDFIKEEPELEAAETSNEEPELKATEILNEESESIAADIINQEVELKAAETEIEQTKSEVTEPSEDEFIVGAQEVPKESNITNVTPLYDDPNKALTADEIAALFASIGK